MSPAPSEICNKPIPLPPSIWHFFNAVAQEHAEEPAISVMHQPAHHLAQLLPKDSQTSTEACLSWTYAELKHAALRLAAALQKHGVARGSAIVYFLPNGIEGILLIWVAAILQLTIVPQDPGLVDSGREAQLSEFVRRMPLDNVVAPTGQAAQHLDCAMETCGVAPKTRFTFESSTVPGWTDLVANAAAAGEQDLESSSLAQDLVLEEDGRRTAFICFTSGSTGKPKGCLLSAGNMLFTAHNHFGMPGLTSPMILHWVAFRAVFNHITHFMAAIGGHIVMPAALFSPSSTLHAIERFRAENVILVPPMLHAVLRDPSFGSRDLSSLRRVSFGADMVTTDVLAQAYEHLPAAAVSTCAGMSEACGAVGWFPRSPGFALPEYNNIVSVGSATPGGMVRICGENGQVVDRGVPGELHYGGQAVIAKYMADAQPEAFYDDEQGHWIKTGDRAFMDQEGHLFILGRIKDIIKRLGASLSPSVVESVLNRTKGIEAAVFAIPHATLGEVPVAAVKDSPEARDRRYLFQLVRDQLGYEYVLEDMVTLSELGMAGFPWTETNKVLKRALQDAYLARRGKGAVAV